MTCSTSAPEDSRAGLKSVGDQNDAPCVNNAIEVRTLTPTKAKANDTKRKGLKRL